MKALDALDEVIALIRASETVDIARAGLIELLDVDEIQAQAILDMQLRRLAALERQRIVDDLAKIEAEIADLEDILAKPERQRAIVHDELAEIVEKHGDDRRTRIIAADGDVSDEDLIAREDVVVTITETGYAKRTKTDLYRSQKRGGKGVQGAGLKQDDIVRHFFVCSTHDWILFFTTQGRVYRTKAYDLPEASRTARGQHVANLLAFQPEERIAQVIQIKSYEDAPYLVLATRNGLVKKTKLTDFDSNRSSGIVAVNLRDGDELVGAVLCSSEEDLLLVSAKGQSIRFSATDDALRPMGRATSGVQGMRFNTDDDLLSLNVVREGTYLLVATAGGYAKRTAIEEYTAQGRGGKGILTIQYDTRRGKLVGALMVDDDSEVYAITSGGGVIRTKAKQVRKAGRQTKGVRLMNLGEGDTLLAIARNAEEADITRTAIRRSTTPWCAWRSRGRCGTRWWTGRETSVHRATTRRQPCDTPRRGSRRSQWRCCVKSTRRQSISSRTTTAGCKSRPCCRAGSRTCSPTDPAASPSAWRPTFRRTTSGNSPRPSTGAWRTTRPMKRPPWPRSGSGSRAPTSPPTV